MKNFLFTAAALAALAAIASAECPNACSGHGLCREHDQCKCEPNYFGADCSQRVCPHDYAFTDFPAGDLNHDGVRSGETYVQLNSGKGPSSNAPAYELFPTDKTVGLFEAQKDEAHFYMECSGKGDCDRAAGECKCQPGYTGSACQRTTCPNDCSGHGLCRTLKEIASGALSRRATGGVAGHQNLAGVRAGFDYSLWDADKHQMCICDAGFEGIDCTQRTCPRGDDPLTPATERWCGGKKCEWEVQKFTLPTGPTSTFKLSFVDPRNQTLVAYFDYDSSAPAGFVNPLNKDKELAGPITSAGTIMNALRSIPGGVLQLVEVTAGAVSGAAASTFEVTFVGLAGDQYLMELEAVATTASTGILPTITTAGMPQEVTKGNREDIECSGRGVCDRGTGLCGCFSGYFGVACEYQNALTAGSSASVAGVVGGGAGGF